MVNTRSQHLEIPFNSVAGTSNNQGMVVFKRRMTKSLEALNNQNEYLNTRLMVAKAQNS
jgi:hypothetical protein